MTGMVVLDLKIAFEKTSHENFFPKVVFYKISNQVIPLE